MIDKEQSKQGKPSSKFYYGYIIVVSVFVLQVAMYGPIASYGVFFKPIQSEFGWSRALVSGARSLAGISQGVSSILMGSLCDRWGPRVVLSICGLLLGAGYIMMSQVHSAWQLYFYFIALVGMGMGGIITPQMSTITRWFVKKRGMVMGVVIIGGGTGGLLVPPAVEWLISKYDWQIASLILGCAVLIAIVVASQFMKRDPAASGLKAYGDETKTDVRTPIWGLSFKEAIRKRQLWTAAAAGFCFGFGYNLIMVHIVPYATDAGISSAVAAYILATVGGISLLSSLPVGLMTDKIGSRKSFALCGVFLAISMLLLFRSSGVFSLYLSAFFMGIVGSALPISNSTLVAELFGVKSSGLILGVCTFALSVGTGVGPFVAGYIFDVNESYHPAFLLGAALAITGFVLAMSLKPIKPALMGN
jgi:MFS family permease